MTSNRSFFNPRLVRETMKRNAWAAVLSFIGFFFCMPLPVAMVIQGQDFDPAGTARENAIQYTSQTVAAILSYENPFVKGGMCIMAVLCGVALFSYLHSRQRVDFYHALPVRRSALFLTHYVTGLLAVLPAYLIMYALGLVLAGALGMGGALSAGLVGKTLLINLLFFLLIYTVSALAAILTGNTILAVLLDAWLLFSLPLAALLAGTLGGMYLTTWSSSSLLDWFLTYTSPVVLYFITGIGAPIHLGGDAVWVGVCKTLAAVFVLWLALTALALVLFQRRKSERAGTAVAFEGLKPPLKWYMVLLIALVFGIVFQGIGGEFWIWFGLLAGTVLGHIVIEILYHFDLRAAFAHWKTMIVLAVAAVAIVAGVQRDVLGYDTWLPKEDKIQAAGLSTGISTIHTEDTNPVLHDSVDVGPVLTDPDVIHAVYTLAQKGVEQLDRQQTELPEEESYENAIQLNVTYDLGSRMASRNYTVPLDDSVLDLLAQIRFSEEYIRHASKVYEIDLEQEETAASLDLKVRTNAKPSDMVSAVISDPAQAVEIIRALQEESLTLTREQAESTVPALRIDALYQVEEGGATHQESVQYIPVYPTYTKTLALLKQYGGVEPEPLTAAGLDSIRISWYDPAWEEAEAAGSNGGGAVQSGEAIDAEWADSADSIARSGTAIVTDPAQIEALLQNAMLEPVVQSCDVGYPAVYSDEYTIEAVFPNNSSCILYYRTGAFPKELCESICKPLAN